MPSGRTEYLAEGRRSSALEVYLLGRVDFDAALFLQRRFVDQTRMRRDRHGTLLICEHPPIVTIGRDGRRSHLRISQREFTSLGMDVRWVRRGGGCLVHAPGQLAVYPMLPLRRLRLGPADYRTRVERAVVRAACDVRVPASPAPVGPSMWTRSGPFAFLGAAMTSGVTYHGVFVNVGPDLIVQRLVHTAVGNTRISSLEAQRQCVVPMHKVRESLIRYLADEFGYTRTHVYSGHPLLRRTRRPAFPVHCSNQCEMDTIIDCSF